MEIYIYWIIVILQVTMLMDAPTTGHVTMVPYATRVTTYASARKVSLVTIVKKEVCSVCYYEAFLL